jgi:hypothetical protein
MAFTKMRGALSLLGEVSGDTNPLRAWTTAQPPIPHADNSSFQIAPRSSATCCSSVTSLVCISDRVVRGRNQTHHFIREDYRTSDEFGVTTHGTLTKSYSQRPRLRWYVSGPTQHADLQSEPVVQRGFVINERPTIGEA